MEDNARDFTKRERPVPKISPASGFAASGCKGSAAGDALFAWFAPGGEDLGRGCLALERARDPDEEYRAHQHEAHARQRVLPPQRSVAAARADGGEVQAHGALHALRCSRKGARSLHLGKLHIELDVAIYGLACEARLIGQCDADPRRGAARFLARFRVDGRAPVVLVRAGRRGVSAGAFADVGNSLSAPVAFDALDFWGLLNR